MKLLLPILLFISTACFAHPIHVSVCEINHHPVEEYIEIKIRIFADDFEDVLEERTGLRTLLNTEDELPKANDYIFEYLQEKFAISINGSVRSFEFVGKEYDELAAICTLKIRNVKSISTMVIANEVMLHWFKDQVNVTHIDCNDELKSTFFSNKREREEFEWK